MQKLAADSGLDGEGEKNSSVDRVYLAMEGHKPVIICQKEISSV